jgi:hypothetical protein
VQKREPQRVPADAADAAQWIAGYLRTEPPPVNALDKWIPSEARGQKITKVLDEIRAVRNMVAHGLVDPDDSSRGISSADDPALVVEVEKWLPTLRALASKVLDEGGLTEVPLGMPPALAVDSIARSD